MRTIDRTRPRNVYHVFSRVWLDLVVPSNFTTVLRSLGRVRYG